LAERQFLVKGIVGDAVPRISAEHEQEVRDRIVRAATAVFAEKGYHGATIADIVARSGLSVGAIYTHFRGKDELFLLACDVTAERGLEELGARLASLTTTPERLATALAYYVETIDSFDGEPGQVSLVRAWAEADIEPGVRDMLVRRRERLVGAATLLLQEGVARGDLPAWVDVDDVARAYTALLDGLLLQRIEAGTAFEPAEALRRARVMLEVLLAAAQTARPQVPAA
jgi:AcrR family transcriptional regulator